MLTFSHHCIKINVSTACRKQGAFDLEWTLDDLIDIKCQFFQSVSFLVWLVACIICFLCMKSLILDVYFLQSGTVIIKINVISRNANQLDDVSDTSGEYSLNYSLSCLTLLFNFIYKLLR